MVVNGEGSLKISNFKFARNSPCIVSAETESGSFTMARNFNGQVNRNFGIPGAVGLAGGNTLTLNGTAAGNTISGKWSLAGAGCTGAGTFTMVTS